MNPKINQTFDGKPIPQELLPLLSQTGVTDIALGLKVTRGKFTDQLAWIVYVDEKIAEGKLPVGSIVPRFAGGLPTDVQLDFKADQFELNSGAADDTQYRSPVTGGIQIGTAQSMGIAHIGTLGCFARKNDDRSIVLLSNYHVVFAGEAKKGDNIYQPGGANTPDDDIIATIDSGSIGGPVDCAIATLKLESSSTCCCKRPINYRQKITNSYSKPGISIAGVRSPVVGTIVYKTGIHGKTAGKIVAVGKDVKGKIDYSSEDLTIGSSFPFTNQVVIVFYDENIQQVDPSVAFAESGDSGSVVTDNGGFVMALHFASTKATTGNHLSLANSITEVEKALGITIFPDNPSGKATAAITPLNPTEVALSTPDISAGDLAVANLSFQHGNKSVTEPTVHWVLDAFPELRTGDLLEDLIRRHHEEITELVNHRRPVTVTWHRMNGPAWINHFFNSVRTAEYKIPAVVKGVSSKECLVQMREVLYDHGSIRLRKDIDEYSSCWIEAIQNTDSAISFLNQLNSLLCLQHQGL